MASIPLPALTINPSKDYDPVGQYGKVLALKSLIQNQQYQNQARPLELQQQQLQVNQQQQQLKDQQAITQSLLGWDGKDPASLSHSILQNGGTGNAALGAAQHFLDIRVKTAEAIKNEGQGALDKANALQKQYDALSGHLNSLTQLPPEQLPQALNQAAQQWAQQGGDPADVQRIQSLGQLPPDQAKAQLPLYIKGLNGLSSQISQGKEIADTAKITAELPGVQATAQQTAQKAADANAWVDAHPGKTLADYENTQAATKKGMEEAAAFPYQSKLVAVRQQVENAFWNNKDAIGKVEQNVIKPFSDQMQQTAQLNSALDQAAQGNSAAAQAVIPKLVGISQPVGSHRYNQAEAHQLASQGNIPQRFESTILKAINGEQWTPQMISDMRDLAKAQSQVAVNSANAQIDNINTLHGAKIGHVGSASPTQKSAAPPKVGDVQQGYTFKGGDPADPNSWTK